jgi:two-component system, response regulator
MSDESKNSPRILLAEDSEDDAYFFQRALKKSCLGCSFVRAANGKLAIEFLAEANRNVEDAPSLLFLDLKMPVMSGFEVLDWIKLARLNFPLKVVVLSGSNDSADRMRAASLGAADYLVKPITADDLKRQVENLASTHQEARFALES